MPTHPDAIGYLNDLATEINEPWFKMVCDLAAVSGVSVLDELTRDTLIAIYREKASYIGINPPSTANVAAAPATTSADFLDQLSGFTNFKLLGDSLKISFTKRITLIFGANGSGKSSLCEALKVLSTPESPNRPLQNVRAPGVSTPTFRYKFKSDTAHQTWTPTIGYGPRQTTVKYFDTAIAIKNVKNAVDPGRVIVLTPFRLHVFDWTKSLTTKFREALIRAQSDNSLKLTQALEAIRTDFLKFKTHPLGLIDDKTVAILNAQIKLGEEFKDQRLLREKQAAAVELEKAASEDGLKLLRAEHRDMEALLASLDTLLTSAAALWEIDPVAQAVKLSSKQTEQKVLAKALIPTDGTLDALLVLLRAASTLCKLDEAEGHACPLCKRDLNIPEVELFKQYHDLLAGPLEKEITVLKGNIAKAVELENSVSNLDRRAWEKSTTLPPDILAAAKSASDLIIACCDVTKEPTLAAKAALESLKAAALGWAAQQDSKKTAIEAAVNGAEEPAKQLAKLRVDIEPLEYAQAIVDRLEKLRDAQRIAVEAAFWTAKLPTFTRILKLITEKVKKAHEELVVEDFEARLGAEYIALTEKKMTDFGVILARKGADASVTVLPQIGGKEIEGVLSEGEQRVHALALFFAELETCPHSVVVFDDPVSSFDYNYIENYCIRLRNHVLSHSTRQLIVLTHNWEFFTQLQATLKRDGATNPNEYSVMLLEGCTKVAEYSERIDELKRQIELVLSLPDEPTKMQKEDMAGDMRRLIETIMNKHVFADSRQQYKQRTQAVSEFHKFTQLVPLLPAEALELKDLFGKLSKSEHDDDRNSYVNTDKAMFQTRYDRIKKIESDIVARK